MAYEVKDLRWGGYGGYEGWYSFGPAVPPPITEAIESAYLAIVCRTESPGGGCPGACNFYDRCQISVGYLQLCQTYYLTTDLLGYLLYNGVVFTPALEEALATSGCSFSRDDRGRWRLFRGSDAVDTPQENEEVFFGGASGRVGSWDESSKARAALWLTGLQEYLVQPDAIRLQVKHLQGRLTSYVMKDAYQRLWGPGTPDKNDRGWAMAVRAAFLSFTANNPTIAAKNLARVSRSDIFSKDGAIEVIKSLTFSDGNPVIYPKRFEDIRSAIELHAKVDLPDTRKDLLAWQASTLGHTDPSVTPALLTTKDIQQKLVDLGYDLGPKGADGIMGSKTTQAIITFQRLNKLVPDGIVGPKTRAALIAA